MKLSVCIPTYNRPVQVGTLLDNLLEQQRLPDEVVIVDASPDDATDKVCEVFAGRFPSLVYRHAEKGLTRQRNLAIDLATGDIVVFLDDDVLLEPEFLAAAEQVFENDEAGRIGGVTGIQTNMPEARYGPTWRLKRLLGIIETDEPGRLLACGETTPLPRPEPGEMIRVNILPGGLTAWRKQVFTRFRYAHFFEGYGLGEDKYFSACANCLYDLVVSGDIKAQHFHVSGNRPNYLRRGYCHVYNHCLIMRECAAGTWGWVRFTLFHGLDIADDLTLWPFKAGRLRALCRGLGKLAGLIGCLVARPELAENDPARGNRQECLHGKVEVDC